MVRYLSWTGLSLPLLCLLAFTERLILSVFDHRICSMVPIPGSPSASNNIAVESSQLIIRLKQVIDMSVQACSHQQHGMMRLPVQTCACHHGMIRLSVQACAHHQHGMMRLTVQECSHHQHGMMRLSVQACSHHQHGMMRLSVQAC